MQNVFDKLYQQSLKGKRFTNLLDIITAENNILLAYRNIKSNKGSRTSGVDKRKDDSYSNLVLVTTDVHRLLHATKSETIKAYMDMIGPDKKQIAKINRLRKMLDLPDI